MLTHGNLAGNAYNIKTNIGFRENSDYLHVTPMFHLADIGPSYALSMLAGTHHFLSIFDVDNLLRTLQDEKITDVGLVPSMIGWIINHPDILNYDLTNLRSILYGSSPITETILKDALKIFSNVQY